MKRTASRLLFNLSVGQLRTVFLSTLHICWKNNWLSWTQSKFLFLYIRFCTHLFKCFFKNRAQTMPTTSQSYLVFLHPNGRLSHGHFWFVPFLNFLANSWSLKKKQQKIPQQKFHLVSIFDQQVLDEATVLFLLDAATNFEIAQHFLATKLFSPSSKAFRTIQERKNHFWTLWRN